LTSCSADMAVISEDEVKNYTRKIGDRS